MTQYSSAPGGSRWEEEKQDRDGGVPGGAVTRQSGSQADPAGGLHGK